MNNQIAKRAVIGMGIFILVIIFVMIIASCSGNRTYTYKELENKMVSLAKQKYNDDSLLPKENGGSLEVSLQSFVDEGSLKNIQDIVENNSVCSGHVEIINNNDNYLYLPYLNCGADYKSKTLYETLTNNVVTMGNGLYVDGDEYIFKGDTVNNYLKIGDTEYRILRINNDGSIRAIDTTKRELYNWDDRYNIEKDLDYGINDYTANGIDSRIKELLNTYYNDENVIPTNMKNYFKTQNLCVGKRSINEFINDGSIECSKTIDKQIFGLVQLNEFFKVSLDPNCTEVHSDSCSNYNYFSSLPNMWTITADKDTTYKVYRITYGSADLANASNTYYPLLVVRLDKNLIIDEGDGSQANPYIIKTSA